VLSPGCTVDVLNTEIQVNLFLTEEMNVIFHMKTDQFVQIVGDWVRRHKKCVELKGDYVEKS
jgi:hypothetical protein